jgi:hypothetical protein
MERQKQNRVKLQIWREQVQAKEETSSCENSSAHRRETPRARSVDAAEMRRRQSQNIQQAREKREKILHMQSELKRREEKQLQLAKEAESKVVGNNVESKVMEPTKASESHRLRQDELDANERRRNSRGAHERSVAYGGYDLKFSGRAVPAWRKGIG